MKKLTNLTESTYTKKENNPIYKITRKERNYTKKEPEPLIELLYQEFPKMDPIIIERTIKTTLKWLDQKHKQYKKDCNIIEKKLGEKDIGTLVSKSYPRCIETLIEELNRNFKEK